MSWRPLPAASDAVAVERPAPPAARGGAPTDSRRRVLDVYLVEDNERLLESLIAALEELAPIRIVGTAADESVAVRWLQDGAERCDLVIADIFLRTGSGLGVIAAAQGRRPNAVRVILSNYATDEMRARCLAGGAERVFDKSRDIDSLVAFCTALADLGQGPAPH
ncbi:MAG: response regulator [Burkholderiaceae bacterium]